jgi:hypothetical protein
MLELVLQLEPHQKYMPISTEMLDTLKEILAEGVKGGYDIDAVLFALALAVFNLERAVVDRRAEVLDLETRILEAGLRVAPPD